MTGLFFVNPTQQARKGSARSRSSARKRTPASPKTLVQTPAAPWFQMPTYSLEDGKRTNDEGSPLVNYEPGKRDTRDNVALTKYFAHLAIFLIAITAGLVSLYLFVL
eukprot:3757902-Pyramimonas_sp.AAC.1